MNSQPIRICGHALCSTSSQPQVRAQRSITMRVSRLKTILFLSSFLLTLLSTPITTRADDNDDDDDHDVKAQVVRISMLEGGVNLQHRDRKAWDAARLNYPPLEGRTVTTAADSKLEIQVDARNF